MNTDLPNRHVVLGNLCDALYFLLTDVEEEPGQSFSGRNAREFYEFAAGVFELGIREVGNEDDHYMAGRAYYEAALESEYPESVDLLVRARKHFGKSVYMRSEGTDYHFLAETQKELAVHTDGMQKRDLLWKAAVNMEIAWRMDGLPDDLCALAEIQVALAEDAYEDLDRQGLLDSAIDKYKTAYSIDQNPETEKRLRQLMSEGL